MRLIILLLFLSMPFMVMGQSVRVNGLTDEQQAQMQLMIEQIKNENKKSGILGKDITNEEIKEYADMGESIAKALGSCAKELNIAVNDFANSRVGMIATVLIVWKIAGESMMGFIVGISLFIIGLIVWFYLFRKMCIVKSITYHENGKKDKVQHYNSNDVEGVRIIMFFAIILLIIICCLIMFVG